MLQFGASLTDDTRSVNYDCNMFIIQATVLSVIHNVIISKAFFLSKVFISIIVVLFVAGVKMWAV